MTRIKSLMSAGHPALAAQAIVGLVQSTTLAGSSASDARAITASKVLFTGGTGGAILPASDAGDEFEIKNEAGATCTLYPPTGATINGTTSVSMATAKSAKVWFSSPTACHTNPTVPS
jgi:hypothetical protein